MKQTTRTDIKLETIEELANTILTGIDDIIADDEHIAMSALIFACARHLVNCMDIHDATRCASEVGWSIDTFRSAITERFQQKCSTLTPAERLQQIQSALEALAKTDKPK